MKESSLEKLKEIIAALRHPKTGCPWDKEQTHQTLRRFVIEEAYEVAEAIEEAPDKLEEELGDLLLQILLHAQIASEENRFTLESVGEVLAEKLIRRHPHVFGEEKAETAEEVKKTWEAVKAEERGDKGDSHLLDSLPKHLPGLLEAYKIGKKVAPKNFDWETAEDVFEKVNEELSEVRAEMDKSVRDEKKVEEEVGDLLFSVAQLARKLDVEPELALKSANRKFRNRFSILEDLAKEKFNKEDLSDIPRESLEGLWSEVKNKAAKAK